MESRAGDIDQGGEVKGGRIASIGSWLFRKQKVFHSADCEVAVSIVRMPKSYEGRVEGVAVYVSEYPGGQIDESARKVFESVGEEYEDLCDRLFADDPVFSYGSVEDIAPE